tara:strand:- start:3363 stop:4091 length:729 start_codon:yes stop_codon:yes gene_type:complete
MRRYLYIIISIFLISSLASAQSLDMLKEKVKKVNIDEIKGVYLTETDAANAIKEALNKGVDIGVKKVSKQDGYFLDPEIKIPFPKDMKKVEKKLRDLGMNQQIDQIVVSINRAAEDASSSAKPIFIKAIKDMSISDAKKIVNGNKSAATDYLRNSTYLSLSKEFQPVIRTSLQKVNATKYWKSLIRAYNKIPFIKKVNPDLEIYVTEKAIDGLFFMIEKEEKRIRENPKQRTTELLKKVFGK